MVGKVCFGYEQNAAGIAIDAMHDTRTQLSANAFPGREIFEVMKKRVHESACVVACCGMHDEARGLVDH